LAPPRPFLRDREDFVGRMTDEAFTARVNSEEQPASTALRG